MAVDGDDAVGILVYHGALGIHAEGADQIPILLGAVHNLTLVQLICQVLKYGCRQFHPDADVHPVGMDGNLQALADLLHPFAAAAAHGNNALAAGIGTIVGGHLVPLPFRSQGTNRGVKVEIHLVFQVGIEVFQHHVVDIRAQVPDGRIQKVQIVLNTQCFEPGTGGGVELGAFAAVAHIDIVHIAHQVQSLLLADVFVKGAAKVVGEIVFAVREGTCSAEAAHNAAAFAADAAFDFLSVNGTAAFFQGMPGFKYRHLQGRIGLTKLVGRENAPRACSNNNHIVLHSVLQNKRRPGQRIPVGDCKIRARLLPDIE